MPPLKVISLERSAERRAEFRRRNAHLDFEFVRAVDAMALPKSAIASTGLFEPGLAYSIGAHGAALSHYCLWNEAISSGRALTVAEDDAIFRLDFAKTHDALLASLGDWDIVLWGWNLDSILAMQGMPGMTAAMYFDTVQVLERIEDFQSFSGRPGLFRLDKCFGLPAYSISPAGAARLKARCFPLTRFSINIPLLGDFPNNGIDVATNRAYPAVNAFVSFPPLAITRNDQAITTIQNTPYFDP
jgi:GR25 family glycosyltransferase involved in LPS biosynthesis